MWSAPYTRAEVCQSLNLKPAEARQRMRALVEGGKVLRRLVPTGPMEPRRKVVYQDFSADQLSLPL